MATIEFSQVRKGMVLVLDDGQLWYVADKDLNTPGNWRAILQLKLKNLKTGNINEKRVRPQDKVELAYLDKRPMQYLYAEGDGYVFMDKETFDQLTLSKDWIGEQIRYLKENEDAQVVFHDDKPILLELPPQVELKVVQTAPWMKGSTATSQYKSAILETGLEVQVPPFIDVGEVIQIDTGSGEYLGRAK
jgi:elongation factor P